MKNTTKIFIVILIVVILGVVGYSFFLNKPEQVVRQVTPTHTPSTSLLNQSYSGAGFSVNYPNGWVIQNRSCSDIGGTDCANLAPTAAIAYYKQKYGNDSLSLSGFSAHKTNKTPRDYLTTIIGGGSFAEDKQVTINGYSAAYVKSVAPNAYTDYYYAVANKGTVVYFYFRSYTEGHPYGQQVQMDDYSQYLSAFQSIVNSIKF